MAPGATRMVHPHGNPHIQRTYIHNKIIQFDEYNNHDTRATIEVVLSGLFRLCIIGPLNPNSSVVQSSHGFIFIIVQSSHGIDCTSDSTSIFLQHQILGDLLPAKSSSNEEVQKDND